jgi:hypothetical protein
VYLVERKLEKRQEVGEELLNRRGRRSCGTVTLNICRSLIAEVWSVLQENAVKYVSNTMFLPLIVRCVVDKNFS